MFEPTAAAMSARDGATMSVYTAGLVTFVIGATMVGRRPASRNFHVHRVVAVEDDERRGAAVRRVVDGGIGQGDIGERERCIAICDRTVEVGHRRCDSQPRDRDGADGPACRGQRPLRSTEALSQPPRDGDRSTQPRPMQGRDVRREAERSQEVRRAALVGDERGIRNTGRPSRISAYPWSSRRRQQCQMREEGHDQDRTEKRQRGHVMARVGSR